MDAASYARGAVATHSPTPLRPSTASDQASDHTTESGDYAALNAVWGSLLAGVIVATRQGRSSEDAVRAGELLPMMAATFALSKVIARERMGTWVREPFVEEEADGERQPRGRGVRHAVGELVTCSRCVGAWSALGIVGLRLADPHAGRTLTAVLASSAGNDFLQAVFRWLCGQANEATD